MRLFRCVAALSLVGLGCTGSDDAATALDVTATDTACRLATAHVDAGTTTLRVRNEAGGPTRVAVVADEQVVTERSAIAPGARAEWQAELGPGDYAVTCTTGGATTRTSLEVHAPEAGGHGGHGATDRARPDRTVEFTARDFGFDGVTGLAAKSGETVEFAMRNAGRKPHEFEVFGPDGKPVGEIGPTRPGVRRTAVITLHRPGRYTYVCDIDDHAARGMRGSFPVT